MKNILACLALVASASAFAQSVVDIKVKPLDGFGGELGAVLSSCQTKIGDEYDTVTVTRDVNSLRASKRFEDISVDANQAPGGVEVVFYVKRKIRYLAPIAVEGASFLSESKIAKEAGLKDGYLYGEADLAEAAARVRRAYQKKDFASAKVTPRVDIISGNDAHVKFLVDEGPRGEVRSVVFRGADHAVDSSVLDRNLNPFYEIGEGLFEASELHEAVSDFPWWNPIGWFADEPVTVDERAQCCDKLSEVYRDHGFLDVRVTGPTAEPVGDGQIDLVFNVEEGPRYIIGESSIRGLMRYSEDAVRRQSKLPPAGEVASQRTLEDAAQRIRVAVGSGQLGLADTQVDIKRIPTEADPSTVNLVYQVTEGVPVVIRAIKIRGNDYTQDRVIRREITLDPGKRMLEDAADRSQRKLDSLGYFSRVRYYLEATDLGKDENGAEYRDLVYEVEEKGTGTFMFGLGASSVDSVFVSAEVNQNNFDLFAPKKLFRGGGQKGRAYVAWGPRYQSAEIGFVEPYFLARMLELSVDLYRRLRWYDQFDLVRSGGMASLSYPVKFWNPEQLWNPEAEKFVTSGRLGLGFSAEYIQMHEVQEGLYWSEEDLALYDDYYDFYDDDLPPGAKSFKAEKKAYSKAYEPVFHVFWTKDARDHFRMPTRGYRTRLFGDIGPGDKSSYWRLGFNHRHYFNVWKRYNHVFMVALRAETIEAYKNEVPVYNRMFLGGPRSIRGLDYRTVAPMVTDGRGNWEPWGGQTLACVNLEYTVPIIKMFRVAAFTDFGGVGQDKFDFDFADTFAWTAGVGFRLDIPMFPIRLDFGFPIEMPDHAEKETFSFTVGYDF